jgi:protoheme IX farnesyltransferase
MRRTARRPLVTGSMSLLHASVVAYGMTIGGVLYLWLTTNWLTAALAALTSVSYLLVYTPMKRIHPICTFLGAFPGAMPPVLGWTAIRGRLDGEALVLFAIVFFWQFPHFHSIAWLYREDYENARIRMLPVVESDGRSTAFAIVMYALALVPVSLAPTLLGMSGWIYFGGALLLGLGMLWFSLRMWTMKLTPIEPESKARARNVLQASVIYLPLLFGLMMINRA